MTRSTALAVLLCATIFAGTAFIAYWLVLPAFFGGARSYIPLFLFTAASFLSGIYLTVRRSGIGVKSVFVGLVAAGFTFAVSIALIVRFLGS
ncbi:hypothetical protein M2650_03490 [Luteimonas sp. SX5]|uniref:Uncharacterized protein n=1 Tax=Luteimonas galliterrae TaxID=2940486 RepID=A0ABT0MFQ2_9GAMM|nr:hypothetical protein [Luteimonas galliterrae]MCL1633707.1 hypothetical protein [Luteimonas galliterrae]